MAAESQSNRDTANLTSPRWADQSLLGARGDALAGAALEEIPKLFAQNQMAILGSLGSDMVKLNKETNEWEMVRRDLMVRLSDLLEKELKDWYKHWDKKMEEYLVDAVLRWAGFRREW